MKLRLTDSLIKEYRQQAIESDQVLYLWDTETRGLGCYLTPQGVVSFIAQKWVGGRHGKAIRVKFGQFGNPNLVYNSLTLQKAREKVHVVIGDIVAGRRVRKSEQQTHESGITLQDAFALYLKYRAQSVNLDDFYWREVQRLFQKYALPSLGRRTLVKQIKRADIRDLMSRLDNNPASRRYTFDFLRPFFKFCIEHEHIPHSPMEAMTPPPASRERDRVLTDQELIDIWCACEVMGFPFGPYFQFLILTAQRRTEIAGVKWEEINFTERMLTIPRERTKTDVTHLVPLSDQAINILNNTPRQFDHVFCSKHHNPNRHAISGFSKAKSELEQISGVENFTLHDFRRTAATGIAKLKHPPHVIDKVLNHVIPSKVRRIYQRFEYLDERRDALNDWGNYVGNLIK